MFDSHVHSFFSYDSSTNPVEACDRALAEGLDGIAFTDHFDLNLHDPAKNKSFDFCEHSEYFQKLKDTYEGRLIVSRGIEAGIEGENAQAASSILENQELDFVISSVHRIDGFSVSNGEFTSHYTKNDAMVKYLKEILYTMDTFTDYDVLGHVGAIQRCCVYTDRVLKYYDFEDLFDLIFKKLIASGKGLEVNTTGYVFGLEAPIPDAAVLSRFRELGGEIATTGSDAHKAVRVGNAFDMTREVLLSVGFKYTAYYMGRKPVFVLL